VTIIQQLVSAEVEALLPSISKVVALLNVLCKPLGQSSSTNPTRTSYWARKLNEGEIPQHLSRFQEQVADKLPPKLTASLQALERQIK